MPPTKPTKPENVMGFCFQALHLKWKENSDLNAGRQISLSCHKWVIKLIHLHVEWSEANLVCKTSGCTLYVTTTIYGCWRVLIDGSYQLTCIYMAIDRTHLVLTAWVDYWTHYTTVHLYVSCGGAKNTTQSLLRDIGWWRSAVAIKSTVGPWDLLYI